MANPVKVTLESGTADMQSDDVTADLNVDSSDSHQLKYVADRTVETLVGLTQTQTLTNKTLTSPTLTNPTVTDTGQSVSGLVKAATVKFDVTDGHDTAVGTSTGTVELPAGATILDIQVQTTVLWDAGTSTTLIVGDDDDDNGWFSATNLQATDMLVGEIFSAMHGDLWGGNNGAYLVAATGRRGRVTSGVDSGNYVGAATEVVGAVTTVGTVPTVGTTYMTVFYVVPTQIAATYVAT